MQELRAECRRLLAALKAMASVAAPPDNKVLLYKNGRVITSIPVSVEGIDEIEVSKARVKGAQILHRPDWAILSCNTIAKRIHLTGSRQERREQQRKAQRDYLAGDAYRDPNSAMTLFIHGCSEAGEFAAAQCYKREHGALTWLEHQEYDASEVTPVFIFGGYWEQRRLPRYERDLAEAFLGV